MRVLPVSYTHIDVYKRQVNGTARINIPTGMTANYGYEKGKWDVEPNEIVSGIEDVVYVYLFDKISETAVSYTHLDVYKRQILYYKRVLNYF